ncbi:TonB family protein [uncultured Paludibaculum sp.]|uniref:TonB family protein n=1 Tax=uncultured Paludibaculum sp. TaxID=1765020 RepID=UPI002AAC1E12|nr:TonB family protein [uncultured Paludibaculum sp.]
MPRTWLVSCGLGLTIALLASSFACRLSLSPDPAAAARKTRELEARVAANGEDQDARAQLLERYFAIGSKDAYLAQLSWFIEHDPKSPVHQKYPGWLPGSNNIHLDSSELLRLAGLWRDQVAKRPDSVPILLGAAAQAYPIAPREAAGYLVRARQLAPKNTDVADRLEDVYFQALEARLEENSPAAWRTLGDSVVADLEGSTDARLLGKLGRRMAGRMASLPEPTTDPALRELYKAPLQYRRLSAQFLSRARQLDPTNEEWKGDGSLMQRQTQLETIQVTPVLVTATAAATIPRKAIDAEVSGTMVVAVRVDASGRVESVQAIQGPVLLRGEAEDAVRHWTFFPRRIGDKAVPGEIQVKLDLLARPVDGGDAPVVASEVPAQPQYAALPSNKPATVGLEPMVANARLISRPEPVYPPKAKAARIQGVVLLWVTIDVNGKVTSRTVTSGHPMLNPAAIEAVEHSRYRPTLLDGRPVEVATQVEIGFWLDR